MKKIKLPTSLFEAGTSLARDLKKFFGRNDVREFLNTIAFTAWTAARIIAVFLGLVIVIASICGLMPHSHVFLGGAVVLAVAYTFAVD